MLRSTPLTSENAAIAVGKFAGYAEYLRARAEPASSFDSWLADGIDAARERFGTAWDGVFQMGIPHGFLWRTAESDDGFAGVIAPSVDSVGRDYPLAVGMRVAGDLFARGSHLVPIALRAFCEGAYELIKDARAKPLSRDELANRLAALPLPVAGDFVQAERDYEEWCGAMRADEGWAALLPGSDPLATAWTRVARLGALLGDARGVRALRFPLASSPAAATALWLDVLRRSTSSVAPLAAFWANYEGPLLVALGQPHESLVGEMWLPTPEGDNIYDVTADAEAALVPIDGPPSSTMSVFLEQIQERR